MATQFPFLLMEDFLQRLNGRLAPPDWVIDEVQRRLVLMLNHVLMQEKEAMSRISRQKGQVALIQWRNYAIKFIATPAGLLDVAPVHAVPDLTLEVTDASPLTVAQAVVRGDKPAIRVEGNVQLAAEVNWLVDHVRWDAEEDLARIVGDAPANAVAQVVRRLTQALRQFVGHRTDSGTDGAAA